MHKCQGLSLDCAIVDLSNRIFCSGMAYVALSRVRSLDGLYLTDFDPASIIVSTDSLEEANRLRSSYRNDLPCYEIPGKRLRKSIKRKFDCVIDGTEEAPKIKKIKKPTMSAATKAGNKRPNASTSKDKGTETKKKKTSDGDCVLTRAIGLGRTPSAYPEYRYYQVNETAPDL